MVDKIKKVLVVSIILVLLVAIVFATVSLIVSYGNADQFYNAYRIVNNNNKDSSNKKFNFVYNYIKQTGNVSILSNVGMPTDEVYLLQQQQEEESNEDNQNTGTDSSSTPNQNIDSTDIIQISKAVAQTFKNSDGTFEYSQTGGNVPATINGKNISTRHRDCSSFVSAMLYAIDYTSSFVDRTSSGYYDNAMGWTSISGTFSDLQVGDILVWRLNGRGHVAIVVKIDSQFVYTGDCGNTDKIGLTATQGWSKKNNIGDDISQWYPGKPIKAFRKQ